MERRFFLTALLFLGLFLLSTPAAATSVTFSASGTSQADIQGAVNAFRTALGTLNGNLPGSFSSGRREINWDGVPDALSATNSLPVDFFNTNPAGSPRGVVFSTPGSGFQVSADTSNPSGTTTQFGNLNGTYPGLFKAFSEERLFTAIDSNIIDVTFFVPGSNTLASVNGFGAVFSDVDLASSTTIQYFDQDGNSLGIFSVPAATGTETFSFLGVFFDGGEHVSKVRITSGNSALGPNESGSIDLVVMDDFIYGEPHATAAPLPGTILLMGTGLAGLWLQRGCMKK
jgi:hypothetical protein